MYAEQGHHVYILETTRGEGGEVGEPPLTSKENLGAYREQEVRKAAGALGVRDIFFLPYIDPHMEINGLEHGEFSYLARVFTERSITLTVCPNCS
jgi:LmbE family N-acetylglucosaminyl deacetylase